MTKIAKKLPDLESEYGKLLESGAYLKIPKLGELVRGRVIYASRREVRVDIEGVTTGVIRGRELFAESNVYSDLNVGDEVEATVIDLENENGDMELSFRFAGQKKAWEDLRRMFTTGEILPVKILEANKGGLIVRVKHITGFLPVSQLSPEHYPRVSGGDKNKILERLKSYVGGSMDVRVLDVNERDNKLIVSEKSVWEERQQNVIAKFKVGDIVEGEITAVADFGAFMKFSATGGSASGGDSLEGLIHISEIAWQRIDHPRDLLKVGQTVKVEIIGIEGSKIFLSMKKLIDDPWQHVAERYHVGDSVEGTILKVNPFGFFVELDPEIHGLAHVSELPLKPGLDIRTIGKEGERKSFRIVSIEPNEHRLGLSLKPPSDKPKAKADEPTAEEPATPEEPAAAAVADPAVEEAPVTE